MAGTSDRHESPRPTGWRVAVVGILGVLGTISAIGFWLSLYVENASFGGPDEEPRSGMLVGYGAGLVISLAVPAAVAVALLRSRWWWILLAVAVGAALAVSTAGVS
ncbi:hypothetical protein [Phytoactinopolyspora halophila]|uniref:hypothetical protein n=1 Tax=Phytoactinopolyspora halophila TaxID=1981511 RepID=UPI000F4FE780|nr:hypothetical protein [Phytoactinopolyspora halophila]